MRNIGIILSLLLLPYWLLAFARVPPDLRGRIGVGLVFLFTGVGHFIQTSAMTRMLPAWIPMRVPLIYSTGVFELVAAIAILVPSLSHITGIVLCLFLIIVLPTNIYS